MSRAQIETLLAIRGGARLFSQKEGYFLIWSSGARHRVRTTTVWSMHGKGLLTSRKSHTRIEYLLTDEARDLVARGREAMEARR